MSLATFFLLRRILVSVIYRRTPVIHFTMLPTTQLVNRLNENQSFFS